MKQQYIIGNILIQVEIKEGNQLSFYRGFEADAHGRHADGLQPGISLEVCDYHEIPSYYGVQSHNYSEEYPHLLFSSSKGKARLLASRDWGKQILYGNPQLGLPEQEVLAAAYCSRLLHYDGLYLHASAVDYQGHGIVFTAASGIGKTTQAELWNQFAGAEILNGDKVILRKEAGQIKAWGNPWKGSSSYGVNKGVPLTAIIVLAQGRDNQLRQLSAMETIEYFAPHIFYPRWDLNGMAAIVDLVAGVSEQIPVYHFSCRPDKEAIFTVKNKIIIK